MRYKQTKRFSVSSCIYIKSTHANRTKILTVSSTRNERFHDYDIITVNWSPAFFRIRDDDDDDGNNLVLHDFGLQPLSTFSLPYYFRFLCIPEINSR